jgi:hypothetical protein
MPKRLAAPGSRRAGTGPAAMAMAIALAGLAALTALAGPDANVKLTEDAPLLRPPQKGRLQGRLRPAENVTRLQAVSRVTKLAYSPAEFDKAGGKFVFQDLPGDAVYDLCLTTADGRALEGIDLEMPDARLARLADARRKQLGLRPPAEHAFSADDANAILQYVAAMEDFMDLRRTIYLQGHGWQAAALVELLRTKEYYAAKPGELIWRVEIWYFQFSHGEWERIPESERVLRRERGPHEKWAQIDVEYYPELSAYVDAAGLAKAVDFTVPEKGDASRGRLRNTKPEQTTPPHVMGLEDKTISPSPAAPPAPSTRPGR